MKLLTITNEGQGKRSNDFCWADEGEVAKFGSQCDRGTVDDRCGCKRSMVGVDTSKASTTVKVTDVDISTEELSAKLAYSYVKNWHLDVKEANKIAEEEVKELVSYATGFPENQIIEVRGNRLVTRV